MGQTIAEKIISKNAGRLSSSRRCRDRLCRPGDGFRHDRSTMSIRGLSFHGRGKRVWDPKKCVLVIDHAAPAPNERIANLHCMMREFVTSSRTVFSLRPVKASATSLLIENNLVQRRANYNWRRLPFDLLRSHRCTWRGRRIDRVGSCFADRKNLAESAKNH